MRPLFPLAAAMLLAATATGSAQSRWETHKMPCRKLMTVSEREYSVCLPAGYDTCHASLYPTVYLLHGGGCSRDVWQQEGRLTDVVDSLTALGLLPPAVVVCAEGQDDRMMWFNAPYWRYEDYFFDELIPYIETQYRVSARREDRFVAGFSMGGGAAIVYGLHRPDVFRAVYDMSGYLRRHEMEWLRSDPSAEWRQEVIEQHSPLRIVAEATDDEARRWQAVDWAIECGDHDFCLSDNVALGVALHDRGVGADLYVSPGYHVWDFWRPALAKALVRFGALMR